MVRLGIDRSVAVAHSLLLLDLFELFQCLPPSKSLLRPDLCPVVFVFSEGRLVARKYDPRLLFRGPDMNVRREHIRNVQSPNAYNSHALLEIDRKIMVDAPYSDPAFWAACNALARTAFTRHPDPYRLILEESQPVRLNHSVESEGSPGLSLAPPAAVPV